MFIEWHKLIFCVGSEKYPGKDADLQIFLNSIHVQQQTKHILCVLNSVYYTGYIIQGKWQLRLLRKSDCGRTGGPEARGEQGVLQGSLLWTAFSCYLDLLLIVYLSTQRNISKYWDGNAV